MKSENRIDWAHFLENSYSKNVDTKLLTLLLLYII